MYTYVCVTMNRCICVCACVHACQRMISKYLKRHRGHLEKELKDAVLLPTSRGTDERRVLRVGTFLVPILPSRQYIQRNASQLHKKK